MAGEQIDALVKLQKAGGWRTVDAASRYLDFSPSDYTDAKTAIYATFRKLYL